MTVMKSIRRALPPFILAATNLGVGGWLYQEVSVLLGLLLLVCGLGVLITVTWEPLNRVGSVLWRRFSEETAE